MNTYRHTAVGNGVARTDYAALGQVEDGLINWAVATGTADALAVSLSPNVTAVADGQLVFARASASNATTTPTLAINGLTARTITKTGGTAVAIGDIPGNLAECIFRYNLANTRWELLNPASGVVGPGSATDGHLALFSGSTGKILKDGGAFLVAAQLQTSAMGFGIAMINGIITATPTDTNTSLTFAVKTLAGADPSASDPVWFVFRDQDTEGDLDIIQVTAALNTKVLAGSTLGSSNATPFSVWLLAINNAGTVELAVVNCLLGTSIYPLGQTKDISTTAYGAGANTAQVPYSTAARTNVAYSILARASYETGSTLTVAGTYATAPSRTRLYIPGLVPLPGAEIQRQVTETGTVATGTTAFARSNSIPTNTAGDQYMSQAITPTSSANVLMVEAQAFIDNSAGAANSMGLFQDSTANALAVCSSSGGATASAIQHISHSLLANTLSSTTFKIRAGGPSGTNTFNGESGSQLFGGVFNSYIMAREIQA